MKSRRDAFELDAPQYPENGSLRLYNMFPYRRYTDQFGIDGMTAYLPKVAKMGFNAVWINPLQKTGTLLHPHANTKRGKISGSLYAMSSDEEFNPLIFPNTNSNDERRNKVKEWTKKARDLGLFPLFDLVLNHVGLEQNDDSPLLIKLKAANLLLTEKNSTEKTKNNDERWPDVIKIDYYKENTPENCQGLSAQEKDLDHGKIKAVFKLLWEPLITKYIKDYGFMGARLDALSHVPAIVLKMANQLIQKLVHEKYGTDAILIGELMVMNPKKYIEPLSTCGLTHSLHPSSFTWGHNQEGGYDNTEENSYFCLQNKILSEIVIPPSKTKVLKKYESIVFDSSKGRQGDKIKINIKDCKANTIYVYKVNGSYCLFLSNKAGKNVSINNNDFILLNNNDLEAALPNITSWYNANGNARNAFKRTLLKQFQSSPYLANLEIGRLQQLELLDRAYKSALAKPYEEFKTTLQYRQNLDEIARELQVIFDLSTSEMDALFLPIMQSQADMILDLAYANAKTKDSEDWYEEFKEITQTINLDELILLLQQKFDISNPEMEQLLRDLRQYQAKMMFDNAYSCAFAKRKDAPIYKELHDSIKISKNIDELALELQQKLNLNTLESKQLLLDVNQTSKNNKGGLVGVIGNHDVGTLKAKIMLDIAYSTALKKGKPKDTAMGVYESFKGAIVKNINNTDELAQELKQKFELNDSEMEQLFIDVNHRMREKIFILAMMCSGGWYMLAGDELGVCHKPEVFQEFATDSKRVGSSLSERENSAWKQHDLMSFIKGINSILENLPLSTTDDVNTFTMHYNVLADEVWGSKAAEFLHYVVRYNENLNKTTVIALMPDFSNQDLLNSKIQEILQTNSHKYKGPCEIMLINNKGETQLYPLIQEREEVQEMVTTVVEEKHKAPKQSSDSTSLPVEKPFTKASKSKNLSFFPPVQDDEERELLNVPAIDGSQLAKPGAIKPLKLLGGLIASPLSNQNTEGETADTDEVVEQVKITVS